MLKVLSNVFGDFFSITLLFKKIRMGKFLNGLAFVFLLLWMVRPTEAQRYFAPRIIISSDIGGDDPDDYQSMVHLLLYADHFQLEGLVSSPPGKGRKSNVNEVLEAYRHDYKNLRKHSRKFPKPSYLFRISKQGSLEIQQAENPQVPSEGASWIIQKANERSHDPLYILVWGSITDVAQAVYADPGIKKTIRIYSIGSWNTQQDQRSRDYLFHQHPDLWWIENNTTFRGMYMGGEIEGDYDNTRFVEKYVKNFGALGELFWQKKSDIKMGDTPSVLYFLSGDITNPEGDSWGGSFVRHPDRATYWTDKPENEWIENGRAGAKTVNRYRKEFLSDWAMRMRWTME